MLTLATPGTSDKVSRRNLFRPVLGDSSLNSYGELTSYWIL